MERDTTNHKTLSIRVSTDGFCFCIYEPSSPDSVQYHYTKANADSTLYANLCKAIETCPLPLDQVSEVKAIIATNNFTTLPFEFDDKQHHKAYYRKCFPAAETNIEVIANRLNAQGITLLFAVEKNIYNRLAQLGQISYYTPASILLGYIARAPFAEEKYMLASYSNEGSLLISIKNGKLELINAFETGNRNNQLYYLLALWKAQGLSQTNDKLYLCGDSHVEDMSNTIHDFIRNRERINPTELFAGNLLNRIKDIPFDIQALLLCE